MHYLSGSSPRTWGCFPPFANQSPAPSVFPTHVGVFPRCAPRSCWGGGLPHARGGVSAVLACHNRLRASSPRTWGCFWPGRCSGTCPHVFPTHVGVFPVLWGASSSPKSLPHARGGVSSPFRFMAVAAMSSPRTWGCFWESVRKGGWRLVFPTHVGVFLLARLVRLVVVGLPHARGGVSIP